MLHDSRSLKKDKSVIPELRLMRPTFQVLNKCILKNPRGWRTYHVVKNGLSTRLSQICKYMSIYIYIYSYIHRMSSKHPTIDLHNLCNFPSEWLHYLALPVNNSAILFTLGCKSVGPHRCQLGTKRDDSMYTAEN